MEQIKSFTGKACWWNNVCWKSNLKDITWFLSQLDMIQFLSIWSFAGTQYKYVPNKQNFWMIFVHYRNSGRFYDSNTNIPVHFTPIHLFAQFFCIIQDDLFVQNQICASRGWAKCTSIFCALKHPTYGVRMKIFSLCHSQNKDKDEDLSCSTLSNIS